MMKTFSVLTFLLLLSSCSDNNNNEIQSDLDKDILTSWKDSASKNNILEFVKTVTTPGSKDFVPVEDRIATFDNDGTLWSEQPIYFQVAFAMDAAKQMIRENPEMKKDSIFNALANDDMDTVLKSGSGGLGKILAITHTGMTTEEFDKSVINWSQRAKHPKTGKLYKEMVFQPMLEVIEYLKANDFTVYIVSGGATDFMRPWAESVYGIPKNQIIGSTYKLEYVMENKIPKLKILSEMDFMDDKEGKPIAIHRFIGRKPIAAFGNSDGDLQMLQWTDSNSYKSLQVYVHHTDEVREWSYDRDSHIGTLDKGLDEAKEKGWTVIDMKNDWDVIYSHEMIK